LAYNFGIYAPEQKRRAEIARLELQAQAEHAAEVRRTQERERLAAEEAQRVEEARAAAAERTRIARQRQEAEAKAEADRREAAAKAERERLAAEQARQEKERQEAEALASAKINALLSSASTKAANGDQSGAMAGYNEVIDSSDAKEEQKARAYFGRGLLYQSSKNWTMAESDFARIVYMTEVPGSLRNMAQSALQSCVMQQVSETMQRY
jgi:hypothetical protein